MSAEKTQAIVIRSVPWSETSSIVTLLTEGYGKISAVAKGARRLKSPFDGALDLLSLCSIVFIDKAGDVLDILTESKLIRRFHCATRDLNALHCGYYVADVLNSVTEADRELSPLFHLANHTLALLDAQAPPLSTVVQFELHCLQILGHAPQLSECVLCSQPIKIDSNSDGSAGRQAFSIIAGGVLCKHCLPGHREILRLRNETLLYLQQVNGRDWSSGEVHFLPTSHKAEIRQLMNRLFANLLDRRISLAYLLDSMTR